MRAVVAVITLSSAQAYATESAEDSYYLSQMRALSQSSAPAQTPETIQQADILAGTDLKTLSKQDSLTSDDELKPQIKPAIGDLKPKL
jgi:hypothetical protein